MINLFKTGDVVTVKAQTVKMTVNKILEEDTPLVKYECLWFDSENKLHTEIFEEKSLTSTLV